MLKLKGPIQLKTGLRLSAASESFCQRLTGNYELMTARVAPKDLLFLLTTPPEFPEELGGGTSLNLSQSFTDVRQVTMEVVNHVVNRILLDGRASFTYQDQVYITTVLRKLGVTDVSRFMEEVRRLREEQRSQTELIRLYRQEITQKALAALGPQSELSQARGEESGEDGHPSTSNSRYYLHQDVYRRLETGGIYRQVNAFQQNVTALGDVIENNELRLSEQLRVSRSLHLEELKRQNLYNHAVTLHHHLNRFEGDGLLPPPATEEEVLAQAAQAALLSVVDQVVTQTLERRTVWKEPWLNLSQSLNRTAENTLNRFETYHSQRTLQARQETGYSVWYQTLAREELDILRQVAEGWRLRETLLRERVLPGEAERSTPAALPLEYRDMDSGERAPSEGQTPPETGSELSPWEMTGLIREKLSRKVESRETLRRQEIERIHTASGIRRESLREAEADRILPRMVNALRELTSLEREVSLLEQQDVSLTEVVRTLPGGKGISVLREVLDSLRQETRFHSETVLRERELRETAAPRMSLPVEEEVEARPATVGPVPAEEADPALLERELREIDRQNRERYERFQSTQQNIREVVTHPSDQRRTMTDALRAIEQPGEVLRELLEAREIRQGPQIPPEVEQLLRQTDPAGRQVYEALLRYQNDPAAAQAEGLVRTGNVGMLNADAIRQETRGAVLEHPMPSGGEAPAGEPSFVRETLRELREEREVRQNAQLPPEAEQALQAGPASRQVYETLLRYQSGPAAAQAEGLVRMENAELLNADVIRQEIRGAALGHPIPTDGGFAAAEPFFAGEAPLEALRELPRRAAAPRREPGEWSKAPLVLRREDRSAVEELVERLEERRLRSETVQTVQEDVSRQSVVQREVTDQTRQVVTQTTEDITALINRTMARQMNALTEKVYRQMERKLQSERSRRGRF